MRLIRNRATSQIAALSGPTGHLLLPGSVPDRLRQRLIVLACDAFSNYGINGFDLDLDLHLVMTRSDSSDGSSSMMSDSGDGMMVKGRGLTKS